MTRAGQRLARLAHAAGPAAAPSVAAAAICASTCSRADCRCWYSSRRSSTHADQLVELLRRVDAEVVQELVRQLRQAQRLDVLDVEGRLDRLAAQRRRRRRASDRSMSTVARVAGAWRPATCSPNFVGDAVLEGQLLLDAERATSLMVLMHAVAVARW